MDIIVTRNKFIRKLNPYYFGRTYRQWSIFIHANVDDMKNLSILDLSRLFHYVTNTRYIDYRKKVHAQFNNHIDLDLELRLIKLLASNIKIKNGGVSVKFVMDFPEELNPLEIRSFINGFYRYKQAYDICCDDTLYSLNATEILRDLHHNCNISAQTFVAE